MALILTYRMLAKKLVPYVDVEKMETDNVVETLKNLYDAMNADEQMNFGRLLSFIHYTYFHYDLTEKEEELVEFLRIRCPNYFPPTSLTWFISWLIEYALSLSNYNNILFHL